MTTPQAYKIVKGNKPATLERKNIKPGCQPYEGFFAGQKRRKKLGRKGTRVGRPRVVGGES